VSLGSLWAPFGHPLCSLWAPLRSLWPLLGGSWGTLGALWDHFGPPEGYLEGLWWLFWVCWGYFGQCFGMLEVFFIYFRNVVVLLTSSCYQKRAHVLPGWAAVLRTSIYIYIYIYIYICPARFLTRSCFLGE